MTPIALAVAGSDPSGGAGIQADLKTFSALGVYGAAALTALTAQNTQGVAAVHDVPPDFIAAQIDAVFSDLRIGATKIGMLGRAGAVEAVAEGLARHGARRVVLDPVMAATSGSLLLDPEALSLLRTRLLALADLVTPNRPEAARLLDADMARTEEEAIEQGRALLTLGAKAVLVKGGHAGGPESVDVLVRPDRTRRFAAPRVATRNTHGTGCTLSAAIAAGLAKGLDLEEAVAAAKAYLQQALRAADALCIGQGPGPVHHFHGLWSRRPGAA